MPTHLMILNKQKALGLDPSLSHNHHKLLLIIHHQWFYKHFWSQVTHYYELECESNLNN